MKRKSVALGTNPNRILTTVVLAWSLAAFGAPQLLKPLYTVSGELNSLIKHGHIQGATCSEKAVYLAHAGGIFKIDWKTGKVLKSCDARSHLGDIAYADGKIYGAQALWSVKEGETPMMIGVWDEDLNPITSKCYEYPGGRGLDGAVVLGDTLYTGVDHYGEGRWGCPPHNDCTVMMISTKDLSLKGMKDVVFDYSIHYGVQTLGTDGKILLFGNYGGPRNKGNEKGFNFSRVTPDLKLVDSRAFHASEGLGLVPPTVTGRSEPIFFTVNALGGNMQGWRMDPINNPPRIRLDFFAYDSATGAMRTITDYSQGAPVAETLFLTGDKPYVIEAEDWKEGMQEWPSVTIPVPPILQDFRGYDRLAVDFVNEAENIPVASMGSYISGPSGHIARGLYSGGFAVPECGFARWEIPLSNWDKAVDVDPSHITRVHFFFTRPQAVKLRFYRIMLLPKGVACPPPSEIYWKTVAQPLEKKRAQVIAAREAKQAALRAADAAKFCEACDAAGQRGAFCLGTATSMDKIRPREGVFPSAASALSVRLAKDEKESTQLFVSPRNADLTNVCVSVSSLTCESSQGKATLSASNVTVSVLGYVHVKNPPPYPCGVNEPTNNAPGYVRKAKTCKTGWWPDPILGFLDRVKVVRKGEVQGFWIRIHAPANQQAGVYRGTVTVRADGVEPASLPITVRVNTFAVPRTPMLPLAITFSPSPTRQWEDSAGLAAADARARDPLSPINQWKKHKEEWCDFLADHYLSYDSLYHGGGDFPAFAMLQRQRQRGLSGKFNLGYWGIPAEGEEGKAKWRKNTLGRLKSAYEKAKSLGIASDAYVYGCDEANKNTFERIQWAAAEIRRELPGVPISTTAYDNEYGVGTPLSVIDWFTPQTPVYDREKASRSRAAGHQVWWYFACSQKAPCANSFIECEGIEMRSVMGAQAVKFRPDGYLYYQISLWNSVRPITDGPYTDWDPRSWTTYNGDGSWTCCGPDGTPLSTVRLENFSDGLEDFAYAKLLEAKLQATPNASWAAKAKELLAVPDKLVENVRNYSADASLLYAWRDAMADLLEQ